VTVIANRSVQALMLVIFALALTAAPAAAAPTWGISLNNSPSTLPRSDERMEYTIAVENTAPKNPQVGDELTCKGTPADGVLWFGNPAPTFVYQWVRGGEEIAGATERTYTVSGEDEGQSLQCVVKATNDPDGTGPTYSPISAAVVTSPVAVEPVPSPTPPSGSSRPSLTGPPASAPVGTATTTAGSNVLTNVITTEGSGTLAEGSKIITGVTASSGAFTGVEPFQGISATGIPTGTTITAAEETSPGVFKLTISNAATLSGLQSLSAGASPFYREQKISGEGIPAGTTITKAQEGQKLILSANATASKSGVNVSGVSEHTCAEPVGWSGSGLTWSFQWLRNGEPIPGAEHASYTVQSADTKPASVLQCMATVKDAAGNEAISISGIEVTRPLPPLPYGPPAQFDDVTISFSNTASGPVTVELELPSGSETLVYKLFKPGSELVSPEGWSCSAQPPAGETHARVTCTRADALSPGLSYPPIGVAALLGEDAPEIGTAVATVSGGGVADPASDLATYTFNPGTPFGILDDSFLAGVFDQAGNDYTQAGGHPYRGYTTFGFNGHVGVNGKVFPTENLKDVVVDLPRGFQGNALATPELCKSVEDVILGLCPPRSVVGGIDVFTTIGEGGTENLYPNHLDALFANLPIYSLEPEFGQPAQFAFAINPEIGESETPYTFVPELRPEEGYAISFRTAPILTKPQLYGTTVDLCDFGAKLTGTGRKTKFVSCFKPTEAGAYPNPLITNPTRCSGPPPTTRIKVDSWQHPEEVKTYDFTAPAITGCEQIAFEPESELLPTNRQADSPTGLGIEITMPTDGLLSPNGVGQANLDTATVTFPKGMSINPAAADGLGACTPAQIQLKTNAEPQCPESSKVGTIEIETPIIRQALTGSIYVAKQNDNPFKAALGIYLVFSSKRDGVTIKVAGKLTPDPVTGQLVSTFTENVEAPFSRIAMDFNQGPRAPLINPPKCGTYAIHSEFSPWSAVNPANPTPEEIVSQDSKFKINRGPGGGPCPSGGLDPKLKSGLQNPQAGSKSPFELTLSREDGTGRFTGLTVATPKGLTAYLKGIPYCPDAVIAGISEAEETGRPQLDNPSCPAASQVGTVLAGAGAGPNPFQTPGKVYLAGPYKGAPVSLAVVTPAVAGPFDLGNVVIRNALQVNPETAQVTAVSDPIPTILHGILLDIRQIRLSLDRPNFTAAPTSCEPMAVEAKVSGEGGATANVSNHFQASGCDALGFKPKLALKLFGGTKRGAFPRLRATLTYPPSGAYANVATASVALPHSEFLAQEHIRTICTRVQFAAKSCPAGSIYGQAEATTPLLDGKLSGPVYLRSSSNPLPDLVVALRGPDSQPIEVVLAGRVDSVNGGIRNSFDVVPDQPVSSFTLNMQGGKKGLLVNSRDICKTVNKATAKFTAQNGKAITLRPKLINSCKKARGGGKHKGKNHKSKR
jgi:hypothetical protein